MNVCIKNLTCYYFDDIMSGRDIFSDYISLENQSYKTWENISIYDISYKTFMGANSLRFRFDEIDQFIKIRDGIRYLVLFDHGWFDKIYNRIKYLIKKKWFYRQY